MTDPSGKVLWHTTMSLDGFIADRAETMDWVFEADPGQGVTSDAVVARLGALVVGRRTMDVEDEQQPGFYGGAFRGPFLVMTHSPGSARPTVKGVEGSLVDGPVADALSMARDMANGRDVGILGASIAQQALHHGLIDEIIVQVAPRLGDGVPFHRGDRHTLRLVESYRDGDFTTLHFSALPE